MRTITNEQIKNLTYDDYIHIIYSAFEIDKFNEEDKKGINFQMLRILKRNEKKYGIDLKILEKEVKPSIKLG
tara:strand:+ start:172 stop:387 length:216 start_codon:yes stop_codon:yes gene_type:complete